MIGLHCAAASCPDSMRIDLSLRRFAKELPQFEPSEYEGDPVLALTVHAVLWQRGMLHSSLQKLGSFYAEILSRQANPLSPQLLLSRELLILGGHCVDRTVGRDNTLPTASALVGGSREEILGVCARVAALSGWGRFPVAIGSLGSIFQALCISYARDWDIEVVSNLLRACAHLRIHTHLACTWAVEWLLDQQQNEGSFGLFAPEARLAQKDPNDWTLRFLPTVEVLWTLAELAGPFRDF
jgi:hypothetical protein